MKVFNKLLEGQLSASLTVCASHIGELGPLVDGQLSQSPKQVGLSQSPLTNIIHEFPETNICAHFYTTRQLHDFNENLYRISTSINECS